MYGVTKQYYCYNNTIAFDLKYSFCHLLFKEPLYLLKNGKCLPPPLFFCKNKCTYKFYVLTIKSALGNISENSDVRFENKTP